MGISVTEINKALRERIIEERNSLILSFGEAIVTELENKNVTIDRINKIVDDHLKSIEEMEAKGLSFLLRRVLARAASLPDASSLDEIEDAIEKQAEARQARYAREISKVTVSERDFEDRFPIIDTFR